MTDRTRIPLELSLYTTIPPFLVHQNPFLTIQRQIHVPRLSNVDPKRPETVKVQRRNTVYAPDRAGYLSNASFIVPIAQFPGVGHPAHLRPKRFIKRFVADAAWAPAQGPELQLSKYKAAIRDLEKKKRVYKWASKRTEEEKAQEREMGFRRSGEPVTLEKLIL
jgi:hypothetical protein